MTADRCEFCDKQGLMILPLRYALAEGDSRLPEPDFPQATEALPITLAGSGPGGDPSAKYITRLLRVGFLYVYDEARDYWEAYYVAPNSYFFKLNLGQPTPNMQAIEFTCRRSGDSALASCITIAEPESAGKVWFGFSDVEWTDAVLARNRMASEHANHMRCLDVAQWRASRSHPHALPLDAVNDVVSEYSPQAFGIQVSTFDWSNAPFAPRHHLASRRLKQAGERLAANHALLLALDDPVAIAQDLAGLMQFRAQGYVKKRFAERDFARAMVISSVIEQAKTGVEGQALAQYMEDHEVAVANQRSVTDGRGPVFAAMGSGFAELAGASQHIRPMSAQVFDEIAAKAWAPYARKYDEPARLAWQKQAGDEFSEHEERRITPLAIAHARWMQSSLLIASFTGHFDSEDIKQGLAYTSLVTQCIAGTQDRKPCFDLYAEWLQGSLDDSGNLLLRAIVYNHQHMAAAVQADSQASPRWSDIPWSRLIQMWAMATEQLQAGHANLLGQLLAQINGPVASLVNAAASTPVIYSGLAALGVVNHQPMVKISFTGTRAQLRNYLNTRMAQLSGVPLQHRYTREQLIEQKFRLRMAGQGGHLATVNWMVLADGEAFRSMPENLSANERAQWVVSHIHTMEDARKVQAGYWRRNVQSAGIAQGIGMFGLGILGGILDFWQLQTLLREDAKAMRHASPEIRARMAAQGVAVAGAVGDIFGRGLQGVGSMRLVGVKASKLFSLGRSISRTSNTVSVIGAFLMAGVDFWRGAQELSEGNIVTGGGYIGTAISSIAVIYFLSTSAFLAAGTALAIVMLLAALVRRAVDDSLQDWLQRVFLWGELLEEERYENLHIEIIEFNKATGASLNTADRLKAISKQLHLFG